VTVALPLLPLKTDVETKAVLRAAATAHRYLAELKGAAATIPNQAILINTLSLQEAKDSSEIESIITTHDELYQFNLFDALIRSSAAKEVARYGVALREGTRRVVQTGLIRQQDILAVHHELRGNDGRFRRVPGTAIKNADTGEVIYTPPQDATEVERLMANLVDYINNPAMADSDPLVRMAIIHLQFECIHPFYDGNGRTGRILNILYLVAQGLLGLPVLYLSRYILRNKAAYYGLLQSTRQTGDWEPWLLFMLGGIAETSRSTLATIRAINELMLATKRRLRAELPKTYSQDLLGNLFSHPYTKIDRVMRDVGVSRPTASKYLHELVAAGFLVERKLGRGKYFVNMPLFGLLMGVEDADGDGGGREAT